MDKIINFFKRIGSTGIWILTGGNLFKNRKNSVFPERDNHDNPEQKLFTRKEVIKNLAVMPIFGFTFWGMIKSSDKGKSFEEENLAIKQKRIPADISVMVRDNLQGQVPKGSINGLDVSRIIIGGNLVSGFAHARDLVYVSQLVKEYHTDEKIIETLHLCEECGINTAILRTDNDTVRVLKKYWDQGGKIQWIAQYYPAYDSMDNVKLAIDNGASAAFTQGALSDSFINHNRPDVLYETLEFVRSQGIPSGIGAHRLTVPIACEKEGMDPDFYMKTLHHYNFWSAPAEDDRGEIRLNNWSPETEKTIEFMKSVNKPWIAFKVFAAGAIRPQDGLKYAFENGADFACVGMFDFQVVENSNITYNLFKEEIPRERAWMG